MPQASQNPFDVGAVENADKRQIVVLVECSLVRIPGEQSGAAAVVLIGPSRRDGPTFCRQGIGHGSLEHRGALRLGQGRVQDIWDIVRAGPAANALVEGAFRLGDHQAPAAVETDPVGFESASGRMFPNGVACSPQHASGFVKRNEDTDVFVSGHVRSRHITPEKA